MGRWRVLALVVTLLMVGAWADDAQPAEAEVPDFSKMRIKQLQVMGDGAYAHCGLACSDVG